MRSRSARSKVRPAEQEQSIGRTFHQYGLPEPVDLLHADAAASIFHAPRRRMFDAILTDPPYGIREKVFLVHVQIEYP